MTEPSAETVRTFLRLGFPLLPDRADTYLRRVILPAAERMPPAGATVTGVLEGIVGRIVEQSGTKRIVIPLTSGYDSRGLLAAVLRLAPRDRILCATFGPEDSEDVAGARAVCGALGVEWMRLPTDRIDWSLDRLLAGTRRSFDRFGSYCAPAILRSMYLDEATGPDTVVLSGYFGVLAGANVTPPKHGRAGAIRDFLSQNLTLLARVPYDLDRARAVFTDFLARWEPLQKDLRSFTSMDILDFGFRQGLRIKGSVGSFETAVFPFEHPDWVRFWLDRPVEDRVDKTLYRAALAGAYPEVFCLPKDRRRPGPPRRPALRNRLRTWLLEDAPSFRLREWAKMRSAARPAGPLMRDFEENESAQATHRDLLAGLDARDLTPGVGFEQTLLDFPKNPTKGAFDCITQGARVECHLRIGSVPAGG